MIQNIYHTILTMNVDELLHKLQITEEENKKLQYELIQTKEHLKKSLIISLIKSKKYSVQIS